MLKWCCYCQRFAGEAPEYERFDISHGVCSDCAARLADFTESDMAHAEKLRDIQTDLYNAGRNGDLNAAEPIITAAEGANIRSVDILIGLVAPTLYRVGEEWKRGDLTVADEQRFTKFCEHVFTLIAQKMNVLNASDAAEDKPVDVLLMNAPGNNHTLALRILALWLADKGKRPRIVDTSINLVDLVTLVTKTRPPVLLVSMALAEQYCGVAEIARKMAELPNACRPRIVVGGYAVKFGLVKAIPGADLLADISLL